MTITQVIKSYPQIEADLLLAHVLKQPKEFLYIHGDIKLSSAQIDTFKKLVKKRIAGKPIAYLLGYKYFFGLKFKVNKHVLIPRPETEWLVEKSLAILKTPTFESQKRIKVLDVGTGSGCIAVSIAKHSDPKNVAIYALDISPFALKVAEHNAKFNNVTLKFCEQDITKRIKGTFDLIVANLPYVPISEYKKFSDSLKHEPKFALTDGYDTFPLIISFLQNTVNHLAPHGHILVETDPASISPLKKAIKEYYPSKKVKIITDIHHLNRFIWIY
ncbi:MAG: peptide chain release factor N(5)-glutamine methyltransferase [bacterium]|nr:peptide chain release factor N(5)-glutamine methyltransferase [bacterium]